MARVVLGDCFKELVDLQFNSIDLTFLDPPFNQGKDYRHFDDSIPDGLYWEWMTSICGLILERSSDGAALYFMQREKNIENVLKALRSSGWTLQNVIVWKKLTSAVPGSIRFGKQYQIIAFATKGRRPKVFNRLRIDSPLPANYRFQRENGVYVTDIWDDIREMTSGYLAGDEAIRINGAERFHKQQSPIHLLLRIILSSSMQGDFVLDPFAGTGTTLVVSEQLHRRSLGIEIDPENVGLIESRLESIRKADFIEKYRNYYRFTPDIDSIWHTYSSPDLKHAIETQLTILG